MRLVAKSQAEEKLPEIAQAKVKQDAKIQAFQARQDARELAYKQEREQFSQRLAGMGETVERRRLEKEQEKMEEDYKESRARHASDFKASLEENPIGKKRRKASAPDSTTAKEDVITSLNQARVRLKEEREAYFATHNQRLMV